jgi:ABC-type transport system substrate-binding protein
VLTHNKSPVDTKVAQIIQENFAAVGISITLKSSDSVYPLYKKGDHGGFVLYPVRGNRQGWPQRYWNVPLEDGVFRESFRNVAYDDTIAALATREKRALYPERREALQDAMFVAFSERLPMLPIVFAAERMVAHPKLRGWEHGAMHDFGQGVDGWYFEVDGK